MESMPVNTQSRYLVFPPSFGEPLLSIGIPSDRPFSLPRDPSSVTRTTSHIRKTAQGRREKPQNVRGQVYSLSYRQAMTISVLPDDILEIFCFYKEENIDYHLVWEWDLLVHICRRWRQVVFASPIRLDLRIICTERTPVMKNLGIWPALPIYVECGWFSDQRSDNNTPTDDNIVTALKHVDRVCGVWLRVTCSELEKITTVMQEPFPALTRLYLRSEDGNVPVLPTEFLGGSAPRLRTIHLDRIPFPALPTLLLSTGDLVHLELRNIPASGYISPEAIVVGLAALPRLRYFTTEFQLATPRPDRVHPPPVTRTVLPALTDLRFLGASEYLEDLVSRIDAPQLDKIRIRYLNQLVDFHVPQLADFVDRMVGPRLTLAIVNFTRRWVRCKLGCETSHHGYSYRPITDIICQGVDWQVSHLAQVLSHVPATLSTVVHLKLQTARTLDEDIQLEGTEDVEWLHLLHQFPTVRTLQVSQELAGHVALALEDIALEAVAQTPPSLDLIYLAGQPPSSTGKFVAARQLFGRPVTVVKTLTEFNKRLKSHVRK